MTIEKHKTGIDVVGDEERGFRRHTTRGRRRAGIQADRVQPIVHDFGVRVWLRSCKGPDEPQNDISRTDVARMKRTLDHVLVATASSSSTRRQLTASPRPPTTQLE